MRSIISLIVLPTLLTITSMASQELQTRYVAAAALRGFDASDAEPGPLVFKAVASNQYQLVSWDETVLGPRTNEADLPSYEDALVILENAETAREAARQAAKPLERRYLENQFYQLIGMVLTLAGDPRAADTPVPKLGFPEITALVEVVQVADPMAAINFSLKLLTVDAALKRYDLLWWDTVTQHVLE